MNLQKLQVFLSLCDTLNYTETAERLYTSQGNVSKQIMALEKELGVELFNRNRRHIRLTTEGELVREHAKEIIKHYHRLTSNLAKLQEEKEHKLTLHGLPSMSFYDIISEIAIFQKHHQDFDISVEEDEAENLLDNLLQQKCDVIFARQFTDKLPKQVEAITVEEDHWVVILPSSHPLASKEEISLSDLKNDKFLQLGEKTQLLQPFLELCHSAHFEPEIAYKGHRINLIIDFIENELGVSLMMEKMVAPFEGKNIVWRPLVGGKMSKTVLMKLQKNHSQVVQSFWQDMQEKYSKKIER